jgi:MarR family transcriptional regulator, negative regulator of the multidrug operon emrRAB
MHTSGAHAANADSEKPPLDAAARTANLLGALSLEAARVQKEAAIAAVGEAGAAAEALDTIAAYPDRTIEQLRAGLGLSQPGAARLVDRLAKAGWVERGGPGGRRGFRLRVTAEGERVLDELFTARRVALEALLAPLTEAESAQLAGLIEKLVAAPIGNRTDLERLCRLCERRTCRSCPVACALDRLQP